MTPFTGFPKEMFSFLRDLSANNDRSWFEANKERYLRYAKEPTLRFIEAMRERLELISPSYLADTRPNGGSMFRIYRDTRFSRDKSPYKENIGCQFRHVAGRDAHAPGFYVHLQPGDSFAGGGIWRPPAPVLNRIRDAVVSNEKEWKKVKAFMDRSRHVSISEGEPLSRPPRGYPADHPMAEDLRRRTFFAGHSLSDQEVTSPRFIGIIEQVFHDLVPMMRFINEALGLSF